MTGPLSKAERPESPFLPCYLVHWNAPDWCVSAVASLLASEGCAVDVTIVDNSGTDARAALQERLPPSVRLLATAENRGYTGGCNIAFADCRERHPASQHMIVGSHDLQVESDTLARLLHAATENPRYGVVAPRLTAPQPSYGGIWDGSRATRISSGPTSGLLPVDWVSGTCLLIARACADQIGGFDEAFGSYVEDVDFCLRARDHGWLVGVLASARASGQGTRSSLAGPLIRANSVLLRAKRQGFWGAAKGLARLIGTVGQVALNRALLWQPPLPDSSIRREVRALRLAVGRLARLLSRRFLSQRIGLAPPSEPPDLRRPGTGV